MVSIEEVQVKVTTPLEIPSRLLVVKRMEVFPVESIDVDDNMQLSK